MNPNLKYMTDKDPFIAELISRGVPFQCEIPCEKCGMMIWVFCSCELYGHENCFHWCEPCFQAYISEV